MSRRSVFAVIAALTLSSAAFAHARLLQSSPSANAALTQAPQTLSLTFSEAAQLAVLKLESAGTTIPILLDRNAKASTTVSVALPALPPGTYVVEWTALAADDGHVTRGRFTFSVSGDSLKSN